MQPSASLLYLPPGKFLASCGRGRADAALSRHLQHTCRKKRSLHSGPRRPSRSASPSSSRAATTARAQASPTPWVRGRTRERCGATLHTVCPLSALPGSAGLYHGLLVSGLGRALLPNPATSPRTPYGHALVRRTLVSRTHFAPPEQCCPCASCRRCTSGTSKRRRATSRARGQASSGRP